MNCYAFDDRERGTVLAALRRFENNPEAKELEERISKSPDLILDKVSDLEYRLISPKGEHVATIHLSNLKFSSHIEDIFLHGFDDFAG